MSPNPHNAPSPKPFIKWAGGKRQLLPELLQRLPQQIGNYYEPFLGSGALFLALPTSRLQGRAYLGDTNERLIRTWRGIQSNASAVIERLAAHKQAHCKEYYLEQRAVAIDELSDVAVAAWFIYLNKTGFNGLYRVNRRNKFNVPFGRHKNPGIFSAENLNAVAARLKGIQLHCAPFEELVRRAKAGDVVYFDPPYVPRSSSSKFTSYTPGGFGLEDQNRLRDVALRLKAKGVFVLLSNSDTEQTRAIYAKDFRLDQVRARRTINSKAVGRGAIFELLIS